MQQTIRVRLHGLTAVFGGDLAESGVSQCRVRQVELRRVGQIERFGTELQLPAFRDIEFAENGAIDGEQMRAVSLKVVPLAGEVIIAVPETTVSVPLAKLNV